MGRRLTTRAAMKRIAASAKYAFFNDYAYYFPDPTTVDVALDEFGQPVTEPVETGQVQPIRCSFTDSTTEARKWVGMDDIQHIDALIRLERTVTPKKGGRIILSGRFNATDTYEDAEYEVVNVRDRDIFGYVCGLRRAVV